MRICAGVLLGILPGVIGVIQEAPRPAPDVLVGVSYAPPPGATLAGPDGAVRGELEGIRRAGFNLVVVASRAGTIDRFVEAAVEADLHVLSTAHQPAPLRRIVVGTEANGLQEARLAFWDAVAAGARVMYFSSGERLTRRQILALGETAGIVTRNQPVFAALAPRAHGVRGIEGPGGAAIDVRLLESAELMVIIALNRAAERRDAVISFERDIPEAIWQNLETGTSTSFVMGGGGPVLEHTFAARDALVLMIRKRFRD